MKLSIIGLLRPKMNLRTADGQLAHLVEHLLANNERLERNGWRREWHADRIVAQNAYINYHFGVEYAVVPSTRATELLELLKRIAVNFDFTDDEIERERRVIVEELAASKTKELTPNEQFERACYVDVVKRRDWDDRELRHPLRRPVVLAAAERLAQEHYPFIISQSSIDFTGAKLPYINVVHWQDFSGRARDLRHPKINQGRCGVLLSMPCAADERDNLALHLLTQLLRNHFFGYLTEVMRHREGLLYSLAMGNSSYRESYDISFVVDRPLIRERANNVFDLIASDECATWIRDHLSLAKRARVMQSEMAWLNPVDFAVSEINLAVMTGDTQPMDDYLRDIQKVTADEVIAARDRLLTRRPEVRLVISSYGQKIRSSWTLGLGH